MKQLLSDLTKTPFVKALVMLVCITGLSSAPKAQTQPTVKIGLLTCNVEGGAGYIFGSKKNMLCTFTSDNGTKITRYKGSITKFGLDIGYTTKSSITWAVFAPSTNVSAGDLAGTYGGISAEATTGLGIGANILLGGLQNSFALQPLSVQNQEGVNVAAGVSELKLTFLP